MLVGFYFQNNREIKYLGVMKVKKRKEFVGEERSAKESF